MAAEARGYYTHADLPKTCAHNDLLAREAAAARMPHLGMAVHYPPGPSDITQVHQAGGWALLSEYRVNTTEKRPHDDLIGTMSRRGDIHSVEEAQNLAKGLEKKQKWWRSHYTHADLPKPCAHNDLLAREAVTARMLHLGLAVQRWPGPRYTTKQHPGSRQVLPDE